MSFPLKSKVLEVFAYIYGVVGFISGIVLGATRPTLVLEYDFSTTPTETFNVVPMFSSWGVTIFIVLFTLFCATVLSHLEKDRNFNKLALVELRKISGNDEPVEAISVMEKVPFLKD